MGFERHVTFGTLSLFVGCVIGEPDGPSSSVGLGEAGATSITRWESIADHSARVPAPTSIGLVIPNDTTPDVNDDSPFSEPRGGGVGRLELTFDGDINPATLTRQSVALCGSDVGGHMLDLGGIDVDARVTASNKVEIAFTPLLPDAAKYRVALLGVESASSPEQVLDGVERIFTALRGDASNDRRVNATDLGLVRSFVGSDPLDRSNTHMVRADAVLDGRINATDVGAVRSRIGTDARTIADPCPGALCLGNLPLPEIAITSVDEEGTIHFVVTNLEAYPSEMIDQHSINIYIYDESGQPISGSVNLYGAEELFLHSGLLTRPGKLTAFTVELHDLACGLRLRSDLVPVP